MQVDTTAAQEQVTRGCELSCKLGGATMVDALSARQRLLDARAAPSGAGCDHVRDPANLRIHAGHRSLDDMEALGRARGRRTVVCPAVRAGRIRIAARKRRLVWRPETR